jgi:hypothetical protein
LILISTISKYLRLVTLFLLPVLMLFFIREPMIAQDRSGAQGRIEHARWELVGTEVVITYDLIADSGRLYDVSITLKRGSDTKFGFVPRSVAGAIGSGVHSGIDNEIRWDFRQDIVQNLAGDDYYFEFVVNVTNQNASGNLWYYIAGGAAVVGTVVAILIFGKKASTTESADLPDPPYVRPGQ